MIANLKSFKILIYLLVFQLTGISFPVLAKSKSEKNSTQASIQSEKSHSGVGQKLAVVPVGTSESDGEALEKITERIRDALNQQSKYQVLDKKRTDDFFANHPDFLTQAKSSVTLERYIEEAKQFYIDFAYKEAIGLLENTIEAFYNKESLKKQKFSLRDAYVILGNVYSADSNKRKAIQSFKEAVRLDPNYQIDPIVYPPDTVSYFNKAQQEYSKEHHPIKLEISTSPSDAEIYINGVNKGHSPLSIENFSQGTHFILAKKAEYEPVAIKIQLGGDAKEKIDLKKKVQPQIALYGLKVAQLKNIPELVRLGSSLGEELGVQKVVLVSVEELGWHHRITTRMIDIKYRASHKHNSVEVLDLPKDSRTAAKVLAEDLNKLSDIDLAKDPKKYAESDVVVIGTKRKKSLLKSPLLWSLLGVLVAGGATSAVLLTRGGSDSNSGSPDPNVGSSIGGNLGKF
ncbi:MAG: PEGA domain-containing protein [Deltaproteobacteria bacterium]|nr:PEGA domain-containing protein [Deltaproteobacteria bacterium]